MLNDKLAIEEWMPTLNQTGSITFWGCMQARVGAGGQQEMV